MSSAVEEYIQNPIKQHIIASVMKHKKLKYSELMPDEVDNVLFNYHLQHLVKVGLLLKDEDGLYSFTPEGWVATSHITYEGLSMQKFVCRIRIYVINEGKVLMEKRAFGPFEDDVISIWGKLIYGESLEDSAHQQLFEQTGIKAKTQSLGMVRTIIKNDEGIVLDDSVYFVCFALDFHGKLKDSENLKWYSFDKAIENEKKNASSGDRTVEILQRLRDKNYQSFMFEEILTANTL